MTIRAKLKSYVQVQFGTDLYGFIKRKSHVDGLYDYEIASLLKVSHSMVTKLRIAYGIKRADGFSGRFDRRYGKGSVEKFKKMAEHPDTTLTEIGRHFGFSKEYAGRSIKRYTVLLILRCKKKRQIKKKESLAELDKRKTVVFIHPTTHPTSKELQLNIPEGIIEFPFDTSRAAFNLVWTGAAERYSNIRYILSHAVGTVPFLAWRFSLLDYDYRFRKRAPLGAMAYLKRFYYDLALSANPYALRSLQELVGPEQVLYGSGNPFANSYLVANGIDFIKKYDGYSDEDRKLIYRSNALKLFPRLQKLAES